MEALVVENNLDTDLELNEYCDKLSQTAESVKNEIREAELWLRSEQFKGRLVLGLGMVVAAVGGLISPGIAAPAVGALSAAGLFVGGELARKAILGRGEPPARGTQAFAKVRADIEQKAKMFKTSIPSYV